MSIDKIAQDKIDEIREERDQYKELSDLLQEALQESEGQNKVLKAQLWSIKNGQQVNYGVG